MRGRVARHSPPSANSLYLPLLPSVPTQFEAELLSGLSIGSLEEGFAACSHLQSKGPHTVVGGGVGGRGTVERGGGRTQ